jgi:alcohol dehydrogenase (cytochrome c)
MRPTARRWSATVWIVAVLGCASTAVARTDIRKPLGAYLKPGAKTGVVVPLRFDSSASARVIPRSMAANLPPATYWAAQAEHGEAVFKKVCAACHPSTQFIGQQFVETWNDRRLSDFYTLVRSTMPLSDPGSLKDDEYLGVLAYLLKANNAQAGSDSLKADSTLRARKISVHLP